MRILWVKVGGLWPLNTGGRLRSFHIIEELTRRHCVSVLTTHNGVGHDDPAGLAAALPRCDRVLSISHATPKRNSLQLARALVRSWASPLPVDLQKWKSSQLGRAVRGALRGGGVDVCVADFMFAAVNVPLAGPVPVVLFTHNVEYMIWKRLRDVERRWWKRLLLDLEWRKMRRYEAHACAAARMTLTVSDADSRLLAEAAPAARLRAIPTGVDTRYFMPSVTSSDARRLVFTGSMDWFPNEDGVLYFIDAILPLVRAAVPGTELTVVGRNPSAHLRSVAGRHGVQVTGTVDDVRPWVADAAVYVVPLRVGGGTRIKIFEALAMGKAVVSTSIGAEGLPLVPGRHFLNADGPDAFARSVVTLLGDPALRARLGAAGRELVERQFSWEHVAQDFETRCTEAIAIGRKDHAR